MIGDFFDSLGIHPEDDAVGDKSFPGGMVCDQFMFLCRNIVTLVYSGSLMFNGVSFHHLANKK